MDSDTDTQQFRLSLLHYLKSNVASSTENAEALKVISKGLGVIDEIPAQAPVDLFNLYKHHAPKSQAAPQTPATPDAAAEAKFQAYKELIISRGYFQGCEEGSPVYNERLQKARDRFFAKFNSSPGATPAPAPSPPSVSSIFGPDAERETQGNEHKTKANALLVERKWQESIDEYTKAIACFDRSAIFYANRAVPLARLGRHKEAIDDCLKSISLDPKYSKAYARLGANYQSIKEYQKAVQAFKDGIAVEPDNPTLKHDLAKAEAELAASQNPNPNPGVQNPFAQMMQGLGGMDGGGAMPNMPNMPNMPPNFMEMMSDPRLMNMAQQFIMSNPQLRDLASKVAQNPEMLSQIMSGNLTGGPLDAFGEQLTGILNDMGGPDTIQQMMGMGGVRPNQPPDGSGNTGGGMGGM
jgi:tetratricopeptide (TPR) repeat protein